MKQLLLITCLVTAGCRNVNKARQESSSSYDSATIRKSQTVAVKSADTSSSVTARETKETEKEATTKDRIKIEFSDSSAGSEPVKITPHQNGSISIDPGGRKLKSISTSNQTTQKQKQLSDEQQIRVEQRRSIDSVYQSLQDSLRITRQQFAEQETVSRSWSWLFFVLAGAGAILSFSAIYILVKR